MRASSARVSHRALAGHRQRAPARTVAGLEGQDHGHGQQGHAHHEVGHHHVGVELGVDDEGTDDRLADDPDDEPDRQPAQVVAGRPPEERGHHGHGAGDHQEGDHQPVPELDERMEAERRRQVVLRAGRPVGAPETGIRQADGGPGDHIQDHRGHGDPTEEEEWARADTQGGHRLLMVPAREDRSPGRPPARVRPAGVRTIVWPMALPAVVSAPASLPRSPCRCLRGADQAAHHRAAPDHHPAHHDRGPAGSAAAVADGGHPARRGPGRRRGQRHQHGRRPGHRQADAPDPQAPAGHRGHHPAERPHLRHHPRGGGLRRAVGVGQPALRRPRRVGHPLLRLRLHPVAEAHQQPEHRHRRGGRSRSRSWWGGRR